MPSVGCRSMAESQYFEEVQQCRRTQFDKPRAVVVARTYRRIAYGFQYFENTSCTVDVTSGVMEVCHAWWTRQHTGLSFFRVHDPVLPTIIRIIQMPAPGCSHLTRRRVRRNIVPDPRRHGGGHAAAVCDSTTGITSHSETDCKIVGA